MAVGGPLVGRDSALAVAGRALAGALAGTGRLLLVSGDPGIGKTALARAVAEQARRADARVVWSACPPGGAPAYWPWSQVLRAAPLGELPAAVRRLLPGEAGVDAGADRFELYDGMVRALGALALATPAVVVLDDLQWADESSLELLDVVARQVGGLPMLLLGTYRELEAPPAVQRLAATTDGLTLGGLDTEAVTSLVTAITGAAPDPEQSEQLRRRTAGNPFFVRELARLLVARGTGTTADAVLPNTVAGAVRQRLARLSPDARQLLNLIAVADSADPLLLRRLGEYGDERAAALLDEAVMARVLLDSPGDRPFVHDLFREVVVADLPPRAHRVASARVAEALIELRSDDVPVPAGRIADHLTASVDPASADGDALAAAVDWCVRAAAEATDRLGHEQAVRHLRRAVALRGASGVGQELWLALADAQLNAGDPAAGASYVAAAGAARSAGDAGSLTAAALGLCQVGSRGDHDAQLDLLREAVAAVPSGSADHAVLLAAQARETRHAIVPGGPFLQLAEDAVASARVLGQPEVLAHCLLALHDALWQPGSAAARLPVIEEMAETASGDPELLAQAEVLRAACLLDLNDPRGIPALAHYCRLAEDLGHARGRWEALSRRATIALITGAVEDARDLAEQARTLGLQIGVADAAGVHGTLTWPLMLFTGGRRAAVDGWQALDMIPLVAAFEAAAHLAEGDRDHAVRVAATLSLDSIPAEKYDLEFHALAAEALAATAGSTEARRCYDQMLPFAGTNVVVGGCASFWGPVDLYLGILAESFADLVGARRHLDAAATMAHELGAPVWAAHAEARVAHLPRPAEAVPRLVPGAGVWTVAWAGSEAHVADCKGLHDLAILISRPGVEVSATELIGGRPASGADPVLDDRAKAEYRRRLADLDIEIEDAEAANDPGRAERARDERAALLSALSAAVGLGGRDRRLGDDAERARKAVTGRIRDAARRIEQVHPELGKHLAEAVRTGTWCSYRPLAS